MIEKTLKVLMLEDLDTDRELIKRSVLKMIPNAIFIMASSKAEFEEKIKWGNPDLILADHNIPGYNGLEALLLVREKISHVPFIFVTGSLNDEERVAETILNGASGYILKNNLNALPAKILEVMGDAESRFQKRQDEVNKLRRKQILIQKLQALVTNAPEFEQKQEALEILEEITDITGII
ncbi:MAG: response regulator [Saprospiraceae bacterium]|nr:response regulator [Lewinella sp.]